MTDRMHIFLVEDDTMLREMLAEQLQNQEGIDVSTVETGAEALELTKVNSYDTIILDVGLPDMDGRDVCRLMRKNGIQAPIIMLTGADTDADAIYGLDSGANDYITKPFKMDVLLARVRAHTR